MNAPENMLLPDVQSHRDDRNIAIDQVGVRSLKHPIIVDTLNGPMPTVATFDMTVYLPAEYKGAHMSRFLEVLQNFDESLNFNSAHDLLSYMLDRLESDSGCITISFPYFIRKTAPISGVKSLLDYDLQLQIDRKDNMTDFWMSVVVPVTSLCPCSKQISKYGAHNQRSYIKIKALLTQKMSIESLVKIAEESASCELYGLLKRSDEKYITERAYENPKFVEDLVRDVAIKLNADSRIAHYRVEAENFESIHNHSVVAWIEKNKRKH